MENKKTISHTSRDTLLDEMHIGGRVATEKLFSLIGLVPDTHVLDIGSGMGGPARFAALTYRVKVSGIDIDEKHCTKAQELSRKAGMDTQTSFTTADALHMPFDTGVFDAAYTMHTSMNITDKASLCKEAARVVKFGAPYGIYDVFTGPAWGSAALKYPLPWSARAENSFLIDTDSLDRMLRESGFTRMYAEDMTDFGIKALRRLQENSAAAESLETFRGEGFGGRITNLIYALEMGLCAPWMLVYRRL